ncbi:Hypothetical protein CAP_4503 [Chondromyces apiculatus DSM 436]|uniref:Uncharacterized protein n=1 Tax=Chondromyces apiculatus DSM 436 TaxID=1192034 RepID=A0A017T6Z4_9BACT|nr:Hypothetical protein CAP_4503 [Chondromyces apiculatus DSM 436]
MTSVGIDLRGEKLILSRARDDDVLGLRELRGQHLLLTPEVDQNLPFIASDVSGGSIILHTIDGDIVGSAQGMRTPAS